MNALFVPGCDFTKDGRLAAETKARCRRAAKEFFKAEDQNWIILTAGIFPALKKSLAELMKDFLIDLGIEESRIISRGLAENTEGEIDIAFEIVKEKKFNSVKVVSTWYHLPRIWWLWHKKGIRSFLFPSFFFNNPIGVLAEPLKILLALVGLKKPKIQGAV